MLVGEYQGMYYYPVCHLFSVLLSDKY